MDSRVLETVVHQDDIRPGLGRCLGPCPTVPCNPGAAKGCEQQGFVADLFGRVIAGVDQDRTFQAPAIAPREERGLIAARDQLFG